MPIRTLCIYCAAAPGAHPNYVAHAAEVGRLAARSGITIIYGGGSVGLMGAVADGSLRAGGSVIGVITKQLVDRELAHREVPDMRIVATMHERKMIMAESADAFMALPGGYGTLDELFECLAWAQLGIHSKPVVLLNTRGFFDPILTWLELAGNESFLRLPASRALRVSGTPEGAIAALGSGPF
jgi:uncharacterized protein (TIGR00730 family)